MTDKPKKPEAAKQKIARDYETPRSREGVLADFRKIAGPLKVLSRPKKP